MGDMNAHIGILGEKVDKNGELLLKISEDMDLEILDITEAIGKVTWKRKNSNETSAIDYMMVNDKSKEKIMGMTIDENKEIEINSDHNILILKYRTRNEKKEQRNKRKEKNNKMEKKKCKVGRI